MPVLNLIRKGRKRGKVFLSAVKGRKEKKLPLSPKGIVVGNGNRNKNISGGEGEKKSPLAALHEARQRKEEGGGRKKVPS